MKTTARAARPGRSRRRILEVAGGAFAASMLAAVSVLQAVPAGAAAAAPNKLGPGAVLQPRSYLSSRSGRFHLSMQGDGNLVFSKRPGDRVLWQSKTAGHPGAYAAMQPTGNLIVYFRHRAIWTSGTARRGSAGSTLSVLDTGQLVIASPKKVVLWSSLGAGPSLSYGSTGGAVVSLQRRLSALGYWLGPVNGIFGDSTQQAVYALQKAAGLPPDGVVGAQTYKALALQVRPTPRPASGNLVEVDLQSELLMIIRNGKLWVTLNTSTGGGYTYYSQGVTSVAITPQGIYHVYTEIDGADIAPLGELWRPKFFTSGYAIHGDGFVPSYAVSHGCVRVSDEAIDWIWAVNAIPIGTEVWIYS